MKNKFKHSPLLIIFVFLFIYTPPILPINILHIVAGLSYALLLLKYKRVVVSFYREKRILRLNVGVVYASIILAVIMFFTTKMYISIYNIIIIVVEVLPISLLVTILFKRYEYQIDNIYDLLLNVALIQAAISMIMFINPMFKNFIVDNFFNFYDSESMSYWVKYRVHGFSSGMMFGMPVVQGFMAIIALIFSLRKSLWYLWYIPPLIISAVINARTGVIVFVIGIIVLLYLCIREHRFKEMLKLVCIIIVLINTASFLVSFVEQRSEITASWIADGYNETINFLKGNKTGYYQALSNMIFFPDVSTLLFGSGQNYFYSKYKDYSTDVGYINDLFLGGIFYTLLLYMSIIQFILSGSKNNQRERKNITLIILIVMLFGKMSFLIYLC